MTEQEEVDRDVDMWEAERQWKESQPQRTEVEWLNIFPSEKKRWGKVIRVGLKVREQELLEQIENVKWSTSLKLKLHFFRASKDFDDGWWPTKLFCSRFDIVGEIKKDAREEIRGLERELRRVKSNRALLGRIGRKIDPEKENKLMITGDMVLKAKEYPIENLVEVNRQGFTKCFGHNDKHPSAYCKKNFIHCFVCQKSWDTIAVLMEREGLTFKDAVLKLQ